MAGETTIVAVCVVIITAVIAWYFKLFEKEEEDISVEDEEGSIIIHPCFSCARTQPS